MKIIFPPFLFISRIIPKKLWEADKRELVPVERETVPDSDSVRESVPAVAQVPVRESDQ